MCCWKGHLATPLRAVLGAALAPVADAGGVGPPADHLVAVARQVLDAAAADEHDRVLLQVVPLARNVGADLHAVRQPHAGNLAQSRVRLLRRLRHDARAHAPLLRSAAESRGLDLRLGGDPAFPDQLIYGRHVRPSSGRLRNKGWRGWGPANRRSMVAKLGASRQTRKCAWLQGMTPLPKRHLCESDRILLPVSSRSPERESVLQ